MFVKKVDQHAAYRKAQQTHWPTARQKIKWYEVFCIVLPLFDTW